MQMVKIRFAEKDKARGLVELARRVKVICLPNDEYLIAQPNLSLLDQLGLAHEILGKEGLIVPFARYEILLPLRYNDGTPVESEKFQQTKEELLERFQGLTIDPGTIRGLRVYQGE